MELGQTASQSLGGYFQRRFQSPSPSRSRPAVGECLRAQQSAVFKVPQVILMCSGEMGKNMISSREKYLFI